LSTRTRHPRLIALVAAITLLAALNLYAAHGFMDHAHDSAHCSLCASFGSTAGSSGELAVVGKPVLLVHLRSERPAALLPARRKACAHLPRGPPLTTSGLLEAPV